jgi:hypothetical protein
MTVRSRTFQAMTSAWRRCDVDSHSRIGIRNAESTTQGSPLSTGTITDSRSPYGDGVQASVRLGSYAILALEVL